MRNNDYSAPRDSEAYMALIRVCRNENIDIDMVNELLWIINAESSLTGFLRIIESLSIVIDEVKKQKIYSQSDIERIAPWLPEITKLLKKSDKLVEECGEQLAANQKGRNFDKHPLMGLCLQRNPLYALLWNRADEKGLVGHMNREGIDCEQIDAVSSRYVTGFKLIQWHIFYINYIFMRKYTSVEKYLSHSGSSSVLGEHNNSLYQSCHAARDYSHAENLHKIGNLNLNIKSDYFFALISDAYAEELDEGAKRFKTLGTKFVQGVSKLREGSGSKRKFYRRRKSTSHNVEYGDNMRVTIPDVGDGQNVRTLSEWDDSSEWVDADLPVEESDPDDVEHVLVKFPCSIQSSKQDQIMAAVGFAHKRAVINQHLPIRYECMTIGEIGKVMRVLGDAVRDKKRKIPYRRAAAVGILMYWTGSDLERMRKLVVVPSGAVVSDDVDIAYFMKDKTWRIRVPVYKVRRESPDGAESLCRACGEHLFLPDMWNFESILKMVSECDEQDESGRVMKPFSAHNVSTYKKAIKNIFEAYNKKKGMRITPDRLGNDLFFRLLSCDDPVNAMLITGKIHSSITTARHYSTPSVRYLEECYRKLVVNLLEKIRKERYQDRVDMPPLLETILSQDHLGVGAAHCPSLYEVRKLLQRVREALDKEDNPLKYNNLYTIYITLVIGYCTGYRAVRRIDVGPTRRDSVWQWVWISDKNDRKGCHTRRVWLAPILGQILREYEAHRHVVLATWEIHYPNIARPDESEIPYLFLVDEDKNIVVPSCSATMFQKMVELNYPLPLNANRKFLRTELSERGCPIDVLDSFMGHWAYGQEPHGAFSCLSPRHERRQLQKYLSPLLDEINVEVVNSRWVAK